MDATHIKACIDAMASSDLAEMEIAHEGWTLRLVRRPGAGAGGPVASTAPAARPAARAATPRTSRAPVEVPAAAGVAASELQAPLFGVVHLQSAPGAAPFVTPGQAVRAGQTLVVIEAMKVFNEVHSDRDGVVDAVLVEGGAEVEAGQPLVRFR